MTPTHMVRRLMEQGLTQRQIADAMGCKQQNVSVICRGGDCNYMVGKSLERLYNDIVICKKKLEEVI